MEIKVGEYVRYDDGSIVKVVEEEVSFFNYVLENKGIMSNGIYKTIVKHGKNIIDLIEVGDYVNGQQITKVTYDPFVDNQTDLWTDRTIPFGQDFQKERFLNEDIKTILTHEQFEQNAYRLEEK